MLVYVEIYNADPRGLRLKTQKISRRYKLQLVRKTFQPTLQNKRLNEILPSLPIPTQLHTQLGQSKILRWITNKILPIAFNLSLQNHLNLQSVYVTQLEHDRSIFISVQLQINRERSEMV